MKRLVWHWAISAFALYLTALALQRGVHISPLYHVLWLAPLLGLVNVLSSAIASAISTIASPVNLLTLGCFGFVLSFFGYVLAVYFLGTGDRLPMFRVDGIYWSLALAVIMALFSTLLNMVLPGKNSRRRK